VQITDRRDRAMSSQADEDVADIEQIRWWSNQVRDSRVHFVLCYEDLRLTLGVSNANSFTLGHPRDRVSFSNF